MSRQESEHETEERAPKGGQKGPKKQRPFGIRFCYAGGFRPKSKPIEKWYATRRGRDDALKTMERPLCLGVRQCYHLFVDLEKVER